MKKARPALDIFYISAIRQRILLWVGCIAGALDENEYRQKLATARFEHIEVEPTRIYIDDAREFLAAQGLDVDALARAADEKFMSAFVRAVKPRLGEGLSTGWHDRDRCHACQQLTAARKKSRL